MKHSTLISLAAALLLGACVTSTDGACVNPRCQRAGPFINQNGKSEFSGKYVFRGSI